MPAVGETWRAEELATLTRWWAGALEGAPVTVILRGDAGAGKTHLVRRLVRRADADGAAIVTGAAVDVGDQLPCWPVATGLRRLLGPPGEGDETCPARAALRPWREELAPLLEPDTQGPGSAHLLELVRRVLVALAGSTPVLLVIEDLQWADRATRELVLSLVAHLTFERVLVLVTVREEALDDDHPLRRLLPELTRDRGVRALELDPLPRDAVAAITGEQAPEHAELVWRRSRGNAFIVAETLAAIAGGATDGVSPGLRGLVLGRVAGLGATARTAVAALALGEEPVPHALLAGVLGHGDEELLAALREAADAGVVVVDAHADGYGLRHDLMRDVVAGELLPGERRRYHRRYAEVLDVLVARSPDPSLALRRAHHWVHADDPDRALPAVVHAATVAEGRREFDTAHRQWMAAVALCPPPQALPARSTPGHELVPAVPDTGAVFTRAADAARLAGEYETAVCLLRHLVPDPAAARPEDLPTVVRLGRSLLDAGRTGDAVEVLGAVGVSSRADPAHVATVHAARADALLVTGDVEGAQRAAERALELSRRGGEAPEQAPMLATLGFALAYRENPDAGLAAVAEGLRIAERTARPAGVGRAYQAWADLLSGPLGEVHEGVQLAFQGVARMRDLGLARAAGVRLLAVAANGLFRLGRWSEADTAVEEGWALRPTGADELELRLARCRLLVGRGELDGAEEDLRAVDLLALDGAPVAARYRVPLLTLRSGLQMWRGRPERARQLVAEGLDLAERTPDDLFPVAALVWHGLRAEAEVRRLHHASDAAARERLDRHVARLEQRVPHIVPALRRTVLAYVQMCHAEAGRADGASDPAAWARVAETWSALLNPYPAAYALLRRAEALLDAQPARAVRAEATRALRAAAATATEMGAVPFLEEIDELARRAGVDLGSGPQGTSTVVGHAPERPERLAPELTALTEREHEVLAVLAEGLSNREIAQRLFISERTVAVHVSRVLTKTGTRSRTQAAALLQRVRARSLPGPAAPQAPDRPRGDRD